MYVSKAAVASEDLVDPAALEVLADPVASEDLADPVASEDLADPAASEVLADLAVLDNHNYRLSAKIQHLHKQIQTNVNHQLVGNLGHLLLADSLVAPDSLILVH
jgi:hypothetical protein